MTRHGELLPRWSVTAPMITVWSYLLFGMILLLAGTTNPIPAANAFAAESIISAKPVALPGLSPWALPATCRVCRNSYDPLSNDAFSCRFHPGTLRGESPRKSNWEDDNYDETTGKLKDDASSKPSIDNSELVYTYNCCGGTKDSEGCTSDCCKSYDDP